VKGPSNLGVHAYSSRGSIILLAALTLLGLTVLALAAWPAYRAPLAVSIDPNEGWNAYLADAAMGRMPLYPAPSELVTNNYPPLSFYAVGLFGKVVGDNVLAGRFLSLGAVLVIALAVARIVLLLGGNRTGAAIGALWFVGTMCRFFSGYVGMDDPQLLAHALMALACGSFLHAAMRDKDCTLPILAMVAAGFFKHNIIAMPAAAMLWLALYQRRQFWQCAGYALAAILIGFALCRALYGSAFFFNFLTPRSYSWSEAVWALKDLLFVAVGMLAWAALPWLGIKGKNARFCHLLAALGLLTFFLEKSGSGVDVNAEFDLVIALSIITGLALSSVFRLAPGQSPVSRIRLAQTAVVLLLWAGWAVTPRLQIYRLVFDPAFRRAISDCEQTTAAVIAEARATRGDVQCDPLVCYRAGKPFAVDEFNAEERIRAGKLPEDALSRLIRSGKLTKIEPGPMFYVLTE
jgi:hypothetical protein